MELEPERKLTTVFQCNGSKKLFKTPANVYALTLALPTKLGSCFMHFSQLLHTTSNAGTRVLLSHLLSLYSRVHPAISAMISCAASRAFSSTSDLIVDQKE